MRVSIIIPCYNSGQKMTLLLRAIKAIVSHRKDCEIIFVDDGSNDNTSKIISDTLNGPLIKYFYVSHSGVSQARNFGISKATGKYITFFDADDDIDNVIFEKVIDILKDKDFDIINISKKVSKKHNNFLETNPRSIIPSVFEYSNEYRIGEYNPGPVSKFYLRKFLINNKIMFPISIQNGEDGIFNSECLLHAKKVYFLKDSFYKYRVSQNNSLMNKRVNETFLKEVDRRLSYLHNLYQMNILTKDEFEFEIVDISFKKLVRFYSQNLNLKYKNKRKNIISCIKDYSKSNLIIKAINGLPTSEAVGLKIIRIFPEKLSWCILLGLIRVKNTTKKATHEKWINI